MDKKGSRLLDFRWATNIEELINDSSKYKMLIGTIKDNYYNPQKVGKSSAAYAGCEMMMKLVLKGGGTKKPSLSGGNI